MKKMRCCTNRELTKEFAALAKFLRMIGDDNRLRILCLLQTGECCVCEIVVNLGLPQNLISAHLKALRDLELVERRSEWKKVYYRVNKKVFKKYNILLNNFLKSYEKQN